MSYSEELYNKIVAEPALTNEATYDEFLSSIEDPEKLKSVYFKAKYFDPYNTPSTIEEFSELLKKKDEGDFGDSSQPLEQDTMPVEETTSQIPTVGTEDELIDANSQFKANINVPMNAIGINPINSISLQNESNNITENKEVANKSANQLGDVGQNNMLENSNINVYNLAKKASQNFKKYIQSPLAQAEIDIENDIEELGSNLEDPEKRKRKGEKKATKGDVKNAYTELIDSNRKTYDESVESLGKTQVYGVRVDGNNYEIIYTNPDRGGVNQANLYPGTVGDATWNGYVSSRYQEGGVLGYDKNPEAWEDLKEAVIDIDGYDISNLNDPNRSNDLQTNLASHQAKYNIATGLRVSLGEVEVATDKNAQEKNYFRSLTENARFFAKERWKKDEEMAEFNNAKLTEEATSYMKGAEDNFYSDIYNNPLTNQIGNAAGISPSDLMFKTNEDAVKNQIRSWIYENGLINAQGDSYQPNKEELERQINVIYNNMRRDAQYHFGRAFIDNEKLKGNPELSKGEINDMFQKIQQSGLDYKVGDLDKSEQALSDFGIRIFDSSKNDYKSYYESKAYVLDKTSKFKGTTGRINAINGRIQDLSQQLENLKSKYNLPDETFIEETGKRIGDSKRKLNDLKSERDALLIDVEGEYYKDEAASTRGAEIEKEMQSLLINKDGELFWKDEVSQKKGEELQKELQGLIEKKKGKSFKDDNSKSKYDELESQMQALINEINESSKTLDPLNSYSKEANRLVAKINALQSKLTNIANSSEELNSIKEIQSQLESIYKYNSQIENAYTDEHGVKYFNDDSGMGFESRRRQNSYTESDLKRSAKYDSGGEAFIKGLFGGVASSVLGIGSTALYLNPATGFLTESDETFDSADLVKLTLDQVSKDVQSFQSNPYYKDWGLNSILSGVGGVVPDLLAVAVTGGGAGITQLATKYGMGRAILKIATSPTTAYFTIRSTGSYALELEKAGYSPASALAMGGMIAQVESMMESLLPEFGSSAERIAFKNSTKELIQAGIKNGLSLDEILKQVSSNYFESALKFGWDVTKQGLKEGGYEEFLQGLFSNTSMNLLKGESIALYDFKNGKITENGKELLKSAAIGSIVGGGMQSVQSYKDWVNSSANKESVKLVQLEIGKNYSLIKDEVLKGNKDFQDNEVLKYYETISNTYSDLNNNPTFKNSGDLEQSEILDRTLKLDELLKAQKELSSKGIVDKSLNANIEAKQEELSKILDVSNSHTNERNELNEKLKSIGVDGYSLATNGVITNIILSPSVTEDKADGVILQAKELINNKYKSQEDAVQKSETGEVPVQPEAAVSEQVEEGKSQTEPQVSTEESSGQKIEPHEMGEFDEKYWGVDEATSMDEGYLKNNFWGSPLKQIAAFFKLGLGSDKNMREKRMTAYIFKPKSSPKKSSEQKIRYPDIAQIADDILRLFENGEGKNDQKIINRAKEVGMSDELINKFIDIKNSIPEYSDKEEKYRYEKIAFSQMENAIGEYMASQGIESSDADHPSNYDPNSREEGDLPHAYRFFGSKGNTVLGAVDITPELEAKLNDETLSEEDRGRMLAEAAGIEYDPDAFVHLNTTNVADYAKKNNLKLQGGTKVEEQEDVEEESLTDEEWNNMVSEAESLGTDINQVAQNVKQDTRKSKIVEQIRKGAKSLASVFPNMKIVVHENTDSYNKAMDVLGGRRNSRGQFVYMPTSDGSYSGAIHINLQKANGRTVPHEIAHAVMLKLFGENAELFKNFRDKIKDLAKGRTVKLKNPDGTVEEVSWDDLASDLADRYEDNERGEEYLAELTGIVNDIDLEDKGSRNIFQKIADFVNNFISKFTGLKAIDDTSSAEEVLEFFEGLSGKISKGEKIDTKTQINDAIENNIAGEVVVAGVINKEAIAKSQVIDTPILNVYQSEEVETLPVISMQDIFDKYDGKVTAINSDPTRVGELTLISGKKIFMYGGPNYASLKKNISSNIGFATTQLKKVLLNLKYAKSLSKDKPVATLIVTQTPLSLLSNSYSLRYVLDAISQLPKSVRKSKEFKTEFFGKDLVTLKNAFGEKSYNEFVKKYSNIDLSDDAQMDKMIEEMAYKLADDNNPASFKARGAFLSNLLGGIAENKNKAGSEKKVGYYSKTPSKFIAKQLFERFGLNSEKLFYEIGEKSIVDAYMNEGVWGIAVGGFETDPNADAESVQSGGVKHPLFNAKFPGKNHFALNGGYLIDELFLPEAIEKEGGKIYIKKASQMLAGSMYLKGVVEKAEPKIKLSEKKKGVKAKSQVDTNSDAFFNEADKVFPNDHILGGYAVTDENNKLIGRVSLSQVNDNVVKIDEVVSEKRGERTGNGSAIMNKVIGLADKNNVTLTLTPNLILSLKAKGFETPSKLEKFYEKFGFEKDKGRATMTRKPVSKGVRAKSQIDINAEDSPLYKKRSKEDVPFISNERVEKAILNNEVPSDQVKRYKNAKPLEEGQVIGARLNLNGTRDAGFEIMSIHTGYRAGGKVLTYRGNVTLKNVQFNVSQGAREAIVTGKREKEPMAVAAGEYTTKEANFDGVEVKFNPKKLHLFVDENGRAIKSAEEVTIMGHRAYARGVITYFEENEDPREAKYTAPSEVKFAKTKDELVNIAEDLRNGDITVEELGVEDVTPEELATTLEEVAEQMEDNVEPAEVVKSLPNKKAKDDVETIMAKVIAANIKSRMDVSGKSKDEVLKMAIIDYLKSEGASGNLSDAADQMIMGYPTLMEKVDKELGAAVKKEKAKVRAEMTPEQKQLADTIKREAQAALEGFKEGKKEGKAEGIEKGKEAGRKEGFKEGKKEGKAEGREMGRKEGIVAGRKVGFFEGIFKGVAKAESSQRTVAKAVRDAINELKKTAKISDAVARQLVKRAVGITTENELTDYMNFVSEVLANNEIATALSEIKKLQKQALKKRTYQYYTTIRQFAKMPLFKNRNLLFDYETLEQYRDALKQIVEGKVPDISGMNGMHSTGTSLFNYMSNVALSNKQGFDISKAQQVISDILQGVYFQPFKINNIDDYRKFRRQVSKLRTNLGQLLAKGVITQVDYDNAMGKLVDLDATYETYTDYYQKQIDAIKEQLIKDIFDNQIKDVVDFMNNNPDVFTDPQKELIRKLAGMNSDVLSEVLDIEDADTLKEVVDSMEDGFVDESALRRLISKAEIRGNRVGEKLNAQLGGIRSKYKKGDIGFKLFRDLMTKAVVFWESQLGLTEKGAFWNYVSQPITRAINQWTKLYDEGIRQFMSEVKDIKFSGTTRVYDPVSEKYVDISNETYSRIKIGLVGHILDNAWKKVNSPQSKEDMMTDWLGNILNNKSIAINFQKGGDYNMAIVMDIYKKLASAYSNDNGGINQEALLNAYEKGGKSRDNILSKGEQEYYDALRRQFETTSEYVIAANSMRQQNSETNPYYMPRSYFADTRNKRTSSDINKEVAGKAGQRASATYERVAGLPYEALEFNVDKLLNTHLEEVYRDYSLTEAKVFVNEVFANARDNAKTEDEVILLDQLQELAKGRIEFALEDSANLQALSAITKLFVTNTLIGIKRTPVEFLNNLIAYSTGNRSSKSITLPFNKKELDDTDQLLKRFNSSIYADAPKRQVVLGKRIMEKLKKGKMDAKLKQEAAINLIYPYLNNTTSFMRKGEWKSNFDRAFKELTGEKFSFSKHFNDPKYNEAMTEAASSADFNMRRIMKGGNKSEQLQYVRLAPEWMYKMFGNKRKERGMVSMNSYSSLFLTLYTGFIGHDVTNIEEGFKKTVTGKDIKDGLSQMGGAAFRLSLYPTLMVIADALLKASFGDDDEKKEGDETLNSLTTPEGWSDLFKTLATQMASTYVSGKYGNVAKLVGSFALDAAYTFGDDNQKKMIKTIMRELYFTDPMDWEQSSQAAKDYVYRASSILTPMVGMVAKEIEETIEDLQDKSPYEKITVGDIIEYFTKDEEGSSAWQLFTGMLMLGQGLFAASGTPIPFVDDFVRMFDDSVKNQEVNNRDMRTTFATETGELIDMKDLVLNDKGMVDINISGITPSERKELSELATEKFDEMVNQRFGTLTPEQEAEMKMNVKKYSNSLKSTYNTLQSFVDKAKFEAMKELGFNVEEWDVNEEIFVDKQLTDYNAPSHEDDLIEDILKGKHLTQSQHRAEKEDLDKYIDEEFKKYEKKDKLTPGATNALREYYKAKYLNEKYQLNREPREYDYIKEYGDKIIERPKRVSDVEAEIMKEKNQEYRENKE